MMSYVICCFLQLTWFGGLTSKIILANQGQSVPLFENTDYMYREVSLYIHENRNQNLIVTWTYKDRFFTVGWKVYDYPKIYMDPNGIIWIASVDGKYQKQYSINNSTSPDVELIILEERSFHEGDLVNLFKNVNEPEKEVSLWINNTLIVTWRIENGNKNITAAWMTDKYRKIKMAESRDICIENADVNYNGKYFIINSSRLGVDLIIMESSQLKSDSGMTTFNVMLSVVLALSAIIIVFIVCLIKCLRNRKSQQMNNDIPPTGPLLPISSPESAENIIREEHGLQQRSNDIAPTESLLSRSLPNSSENNMGEMYRRLRHPIDIIPPRGNLPLRSSADSAENVREIKRRSRHPIDTIPPREPLPLRFSADSAENNVRKIHRKFQHRIDTIPPRGNLPLRSSADSAGKTKLIQRHSMGRTVDLHSSKFDMQGKGSEASTKLEHHGMILRPRRHPVMLSDE